MFKKHQRHIKYGHAVKSNSFLRLHYYQTQVYTSCLYSIHILTVHPKSAIS
uniref:Uncharacterized protein n=1 Tax=Anguilla anguilla TaxID=7936 RepID=A0A0E9TGW1_ANGAN